MLSRRAALSSVVGLSAVAALSACAVQEPIANPSETNSTPVDGKTVEVCKTGDVPVGSGKKFLVGDIPILITQPRSGEFRAFSAICTHAGFVMSSVRNSEIICDNHGAVYSAEDGSVKKGPAQKALGKITVTVEGDSVLVTL